MIDKNGLIIFELILEDLELSVICVDIHGSLLKNNYVFLDLKDSWDIALVESIININPSIKSAISIEKVINNIFKNRVQDLGYNHTITMDSNKGNEIVCWRLKKSVINQVDLVLSYKSHVLRSTLGIIVSSNELM